MSIGAGAFDQPVERRRIGEVGGERGRTQAGRRRVQRVGVARDQHEPRALGVERLGGREADAARGAGDEHECVAELHGGESTRSP